MFAAKRAAAISACVAAALGFGGWATSAESVHPGVAGALYALALLFAVGAIVVMSIPGRPTRVGFEEWRHQEDRFRQRNKNVQGHYDRDVGSRVLRWSIWPAAGGTPRDRELFEGEAVHASRLLKRMLGYQEEKYVACFGSNEVDQWLTAIRSLVHPGTDMHSTGGDSSGRKSAGQYVEELPVMSAVACVKFAAGLRPRVGLPSKLGEIA